MDDVIILLIFNVFATVAIMSFVAQRLGDVIARVDFEAQRILRAIKTEGLSVKPLKETEADNEELREIIDSAIHYAENTAHDLKHALLMVGKGDSDA